MNTAFSYERIHSSSFFTPNRIDVLTVILPNYDSASVLQAAYDQTYSVVMLRITQSPLSCLNLTI